MLDAWLADRPDWQGQRPTVHRPRPSNPAPACRQIRPKAAPAAGIGHVHPHQLRHTLATQAINRGMSLEAIAALLGHRSMSMTMVYARIADRTIADEYFNVTEKVEALYDTHQPAQLPADEEGRQMRKLRSEMHRRMLGNGYCARPVETRLPLRVDLRILHLLRHHHRVPPHPASPARRRPQERANRPTPTNLRRTPRPPRSNRDLTPITQNFCAGGPPAAGVVGFAAHKDRFGVEPICRVLFEHGVKIAPSTYYAHQSRPPSARAQGTRRWAPRSRGSTTTGSSARGLQGKCGGCCSATRRERPVRAVARLRWSG